MSAFRRHIRLITLILALALFGALGSAFLVPIELRSVEQHLHGFPDADVYTHQLRPWILAGLLFIPFIGSLFYALGDTFDRYITRQFLVIFGICCSALLMIWLLLDLGDKISDFQNAKHVLPTIGHFYLQRSPAILMLLLPYSLLLSLLYCLGKLSSSREIIAIIQSGRSLFRITIPLLIAGSLCSLTAIGLNYHWAPTAEGSQDEILAEATGKKAEGVTQVLYRNARDRRLWSIGAFPLGYEKGEPLIDVEITTTLPNHQIESRLFASRAKWDRANRHWTFEKPKVSHHQPNSPPLFTQIKGDLVIDSWQETPWQLIKPGLSAEHLGIPELTTWLNSYTTNPSTGDPAAFLTQWHYRWALPFTCLVTVLLATPLAVHFSRRGPGGGIFLAIVLSASMMLVSTIILAFGEAGTIPPILAAWLPNLCFSLLSLYLFHQRISGKSLRKTIRQLWPQSS